MCSHPVRRRAQVTRERIRQIEAKAILKLRHPNRSGALREYMADDIDLDPDTPVHLHARRSAQALRSGF